MKITIKLAMAVVALILAISVFIAMQSNRGQVDVRNDSAVDVTRVRIDICGQTLTLGPIAQKSTSTATYRVTKDSHYRVAVQFGSGRSIERSLGYVTNGVDFHDLVTVQDADLLFSRVGR